MASATSPLQEQGLPPTRCYPSLDAFLLGPDGLSPLPVTSQHLLTESYPEPPEGRTYPQLRRRCRDLLMEEWKASAPAPARYPYLPSLKPHSFLGLNKFDEGRLQQI